MESGGIMDQEAHSFRPPCGQFLADAIRAQRNLSTSATLAITEYSQSTGFSIECLASAAWSHLLALYAQTEYVTLSTVQSNVEVYFPTPACIPAAFDGSVREWLTAVAE